MPKYWAYPQVSGNRPNLVQNGWVGSVVIENMFSPKVPLGEKSCTTIWNLGSLTKYDFQRKLKMFFFFCKICYFFKCNTSKCMVLSQGIHFWCYFGDLTPKTQNRGLNNPILGQNWVKIDFFFEIILRITQTSYSKSI